MEHSSGNQYPIGTQQFPNNPYPPQQQRQQQGPGVVHVQPLVIQQPTQPKISPSFCALIWLSCFVTWCCGWVFGLVAFILAMVGKDRVSVGKVEEARKLARASLGVSIAGIVVALVIAAIIIGIAFGNCRTVTYSNGGGYSRVCGFYVNAG